MTPYWGSSVSVFPGTYPARNSWPTFALPGRRASNQKPSPRAFASRPTATGSNEPGLTKNRVSRSSWGESSW
jgi:hypothetical protein